MTELPTYPELLILRHGETVWNQSSRLQGDLDSPLTDRGRAQAAAMGHVLVGLGVTSASHSFFTSPMGRARETAQITLRSIDVAAQEDARLREISVGAWTGLTRDAIFAQTGLRDDTAFLDFYRAAPGAETLAAIAERLRLFLAALTGPTVVFTHGVTSIVMRGCLLGLSLEGLSNLSVGQGVIYRVKDGQYDEIPALSPVATTPNPR